MTIAACLSLPASASEICNPKDNLATCAMLDAFATTSKELFNTEGARRACVATLDAKNAYWQKYVSSSSRHTANGCACRASLRVEGHPEQTRRRTMSVVERITTMIGSSKLRLAAAAAGLAWLFSLPAANAANLMTPGQFLIVPNGGSGAGTFTAHDVLVGEGTGAFAAISPGSTSGVPLISQGTSTDPIFGTVVVAGGDTGLATLTAHALVVGEGTSNVAFAAAAADSIPLWQSSGADPTVTAINNCTTALTYATSTHTFGCNASARRYPDRGYLYEHVADRHHGN